MGHLHETSVIQNVPNQRSIIDRTVGNILDNNFERLQIYEDILDYSIGHDNKDPE